MSRSVVPVDLISFNTPGQSRSPLELIDDVVAGINHRHAGRECGSAAAGGVTKTGALSITNANFDALVGNLQFFLPP